MALDKEDQKKLAEAFRDLRELKVDVAYPFLLELYDDFANERLGSTDFEAAVRLVEAYVFRRAVCAIPTNSLNKTFSTFGRALQKDRYLESVQAHLLTLPVLSPVPGRRGVQARVCPFVIFITSLVEATGCADSKTMAARSVFQSMNTPSSTSFRKTTICLRSGEEELGPEWQRVQENWLHTLGNLTLTGYNTEYSDRPFSEKREMKGGFRESPLEAQRGPERRPQVG